MQWYQAHPNLLKREKEKILSVYSNAEIKFDEFGNFNCDVVFSNTIFERITFRFLYSYNYPLEYHSIKAYLLEPNYDVLKGTLKLKRNIDVGANLIHPLFECDEHGYFIWPFHGIHVDPPFPIHKSITFYYDMVNSWVKSIDAKNNERNGAISSPDKLQKLREALLKGDKDVKITQSGDAKPSSKVKPGDCNTISAPKGKLADAAADV